MKLFIVIFIAITHTFASGFNLSIEKQSSYENFSVGYLKDSQNTFSFEQIQQKLPLKFQTLNI
jgi:hypothetical protein